MSLTIVQARGRFDNVIAAFGPAPGPRIAARLSLGQSISVPAGPDPEAFYRWLMEVAVRDLLYLAMPAVNAAPGNRRFNNWVVTSYSEGPGATSGDIDVHMTAYVTYIDGISRTRRFNARRSTTLLTYARTLNPRASAWLTINAESPAPPSNRIPAAVDLA
jgi:hypothetical protein